MWHDILFATRLLRKSPIVTAAIVLTLALGVGINTAVFSVANAVVFRPLPVRDSDRLVVVASRNESNRTLGGVSFADVQDYRAATRGVLEDIAAYRVGFVGLATHGGRPERVLVTWVTGNYFPFLDIRPFHGRVIRPDEGAPGRADAVVVLGYSAWQHRFRGDPSVVGQTIKVNGRSCTIVGVVPASFAGTFAFSDSELYLPLNWSGTEDFDNRQARGLHALARLRTGVSVEKAQTVMDVVAARLARHYPDSNAGVVVSLLPERFARPEEDQFRSNVLGARTLLILVLLVMIIAAVNVTNLLLARATARYQELAIRAALGAERIRLVRQLLTEGLLLATVGGGAGVLAGAWGAHGLSTIRLPGDLPIRFDFSLDGRVLAYALALTLITGLLVGLLPAIRMSRANLEGALRHAGRASLGTHRQRIRAGLAMLQIAVCFVLLATAGLFVRSLANAEHVDLGFRSKGVLNIHMDVAQLGYTEAQGRVFFDEVERRVQAIPGVQDVSFAATIPMGYLRATDAVEAEAAPVETRRRLSAGRNIVSSHYFRTMGIEIIRGRGFTDGDNDRSRVVAIVNQHLADTLWPGQDPIGRRFTSTASNGRWLQVVGVTRTGKYRFLFEDPQPHFYVPIAQEYSPVRVLQARTSIAPETLAPAAERAIRALEPDLPLYDVLSMADALETGPGFLPVRVTAIGATSVGLLALMLAIIGVYGVVSYMTNQRTREICMRMAVGATQHDIVRLVLQGSLRLVLVGIGAGVFATLACSGIVGDLLFGVSGRDAVTLIGTAVVLGAVVLIACIIPASRAARIDPTVALRGE